MLLEPRAWTLNVNFMDLDVVIVAMVYMVVIWSFGEVFWGVQIKLACVNSDFKI